MDITSVLRSTECGTPQLCAACKRAIGTGRVRVAYLPRHVLCIEMEGADMLADLFDWLVALQH